MTREIKLGTKIFFKNDWTDFSAYRKAEKRCDDNWYSYWSMQGDARIWIKKWDWYISKRRWLSKEDIQSLDWYINHEWWYRNGKVWIVIFDTAPLLSPTNPQDDTN